MRRDHAIGRRAWWAASERSWRMAPVTLRLGAIILRGHIDRHLPEPFTTPSQLRRWDDAIIALIRERQLKR